MRHRRWIIFALAVVGVVAFVLWPHGVKTIVSNTGTTAIRNVRVVVTCASYNLGDLDPGENRSVRVHPSGESSVTVEYTDASGVSRSDHVDCYFEPGYSGTVAVGGGW